MSGMQIVALALVAALVVCSAAAEAPDVLQQLLAKREKARQELGTPQARSAPVQRRTHPSDDEREIMTKQIMHAISELMNSECMSGRDYQGWVDFGRRDTE